MASIDSAVSTYPCFSTGGLRQDGMLLHLATGCNMQCRYCFMRNEWTGNGKGPAAGMTIMPPDAAVQLVASRFQEGRAPSVVEIGGPGEPLLNATTFIVLRRLRALFPGLGLSVWTNGLLLPDRLEELMRSGAEYLTLSLNAMTQDTAESIYEWIVYRGRKYAGRDAAHLVLRQQWKGLADAIEAGFGVSAFIAAIPGVNRHETGRIREHALAVGADRAMVVELER